MKKIKKIYVITLEEKYQSLVYVSVLGTFSSERSAKQVIGEKFDEIYKREYSNMDKNDYIVTKSDYVMYISEVHNNFHTKLEITETILDKWEK